MIRIRWSTTAFTYLEALPQKLAFEILDLTDRLTSFPEMGVPLRHLYPSFGNCRQLIYQRKHRVIYVYDADESLIRILALQHCRQQLPTTGDLHRSFKEADLEEEP